MIPNSVTGRGDIEIEIYGMEGIPEKDIEEKRKQMKSKARGSLRLLYLVSMVPTVGFIGREKVSK